MIPKRVLIGLAALILMAVVAAAVFVATFDANRYKSVAIEWMKTERQRTLAIDGPIELALFPRLAVKVSKVTLSERARSDEFAAIDEASLSLRVLPLLRGQAVVDRVSARGVRAVLTRDAKGVRNIDDLLAAPSPTAAPKEAAGPGKPMAFDIGGIALENARLTLRDEMTPLAGTVTLASFTSGRLAPGVETPVALQAALDLQRPQVLKLTLDGKTQLAFDTAKGSAALRDAQLTLAGDTPTAKSLAATLGGNLAWNGQALEAGPLALKIASAKLGALTLADSSLGAKRLVFSPDKQTLELDALKLAVAGKQGASPLALSLDWPQLALAGDKLKGSALSGSLKLEGATALAGRFQSGAPSGNFDALRLPGFALKLDGSAGARRVDAQLKSDLLLQPGKGALAFEKLDLRGTLAEPSLQPLQLAVAGSASADAKGARWALQGSLNANRFEMQGSAGFGGAVPTVIATARFDRLDLNQVLAPTSAASAPQAAAPADTPVALDALRSIDGRFNVSAGRFVFRQYQVADAKLDASLDGGLLRLTRLAGGAWGGQVDGSGSADAKSQRIAIKLAANSVNVNALLKDVAGKDLLDGSGRVTADVTTQGASLGALRSNLAGNVALTLRDGAVKGVNLARSFRQAKAAFSSKQDAVTKAQAAEKTDFSELNASAKIANGVAESNDLDVKSPFLRVGGAGRFDIGRGRIDYTARATVIGAPTGQDGADLAALKGVTVPVLLSGPFEAIDWKIQWSGVAAAAVEAKLKDKLSEKLGAKLGGGSNTAASAPQAQLKPEEKLKERLRGLFGK